MEIEYIDPNDDWYIPDDERDYDTSMAIPKRDSEESASEETGAKRWKTSGRM